MEKRLKELTEAGNKFRKSKKVEEFLACGESSNPKFFRFIAKQKKITTPDVLDIGPEGRVIMSASRLEVDACLARFYKDLLGSPRIRPEKTIHDLFNKYGIPPPSPQQPSVNFDILEQKIPSIIEDLNNTSQGGPDKLSARQLKYLFKIIPKFVCRIIIGLISGKDDNTRVRERKVVLIPKKSKSNKASKHLRPIALFARRDQSN